MREEAKQIKMASLGVNLNESVVDLADRMAAISSNMVAVIDEMPLFYNLDLALFVPFKNVEEARLELPSEKRHLS